MAGGARKAATAGRSGPSRGRGRAEPGNPLGRPGPRRSLYLVRLMMVEEFRHHTSFSGRMGFLLFPVMMFVFFFIIAVFSADLFEEVPYGRAVMMLHGSAFFYGMSMGAFAFFGREYVERRFGRRNFLICSPVLLPLRFRETFTAYYIHDIIFYMGLALLPFTGALVASAPFSGITVLSVAKTSAAVSLSFVVGISFSFFMSSVYMRDLRVFAALVTGVAGAAGLCALFPGGLGYLLPGMLLQTDPGPLPVVLGLAYFALFSWTASALILESAEVRTSSSGKVDEDFSGRLASWEGLGFYGPLVAKEMTDVKRSKMITRIAFSFVLPLLMISLFSWIVYRGLGVPIEFNIIFYGSMVGFFGIMIYSWLNIADEPDFYDFLPVSVPQVIKAKLVAWLVITSGISTSFVVALALFLNQLHYLPLALFVMFSTSIYMVTTTAYLTGLRPNTALFDAGVQLRFNIFAFIPLLSVMMMSIALDSFWLQAFLAILAVGIIITISTVILLVGIEDKWKAERFAS